LSNDSIGQLTRRDLRASRIIKYRLVRVKQAQLTSRFSTLDDYEVQILIARKDCGREARRASADYKGIKESGMLIHPRFSHP
jgi:hypothetical protein